VFTVGKAKATNEIKGIKLTPKGTEFSLIGAKGALKIATKLIGEFNVYNAAQATSVGQALGIGAKQIEKGIAKVNLVPGRMEPVNVGQQFLVLVDYAVTPDALEKVLSTLQKVAAGKVRLVFGATGDRDRSKRPVMGEVAGKLADAIYLTDDETYSENGDKIREAVKIGLNRAGATNKFVEIPDRLEAIKKAFADAKQGDVVVLAGLGHEDYRNMGGKKVPWVEKEVAIDILKRSKKV
jgi:UDP-N-acetylmuramoyl-L-alanyl-D-glutamate--2,6-diaminopimelate ligase